MNFKKLTFIFSFLLLVALVFTSAYAEGDEKNKSNQQLNKVLGSPVRTYLDINNIFTVIKNDGISDIDAQEANSGLVFPKGSGKTAVYTSGLLWGAKISGDPQVRVGGTAYRTGLQPGRITNSGLPYAQLIAEDQNLPEVRIYRVRPDVYPGSPVVDLSQDATLEGSSASALRTQYESDWTSWPAQFGAPYNDVDSNGTYDPTIDIPGVPGADQTIWFVANDLSVSKNQNLYGAQPLGIEMQATFWAYAQQGALGNMFFRKYKLVNKSDTPFNEMYVSMFSDVDLGNSGDDFTGCDVDLSLSFTYNANATDPTYNPLPPPAVGFDFFQGPKVNGVPLPMTAHYYFARGDPNVTDPTQGSLEGSNQFYNFFQGKIGKTGEFFTDPSTGLPTTFALSGDPLTKTGWLDGQLLPSGDRRQGMASGPFTMMPGDEQEIVVAEIVAGAIPGVDRISAVGLLKYYDQIAQVAYDSDFDLPVPPPSPVVKVVELDRKIVLDWGSDVAAVTSTEKSNSKGYKFEGYNVYQLPSASASISEAKRIATFDAINGIGKINDLVFDINTGSVVTLPVQFGNDTGLKRYLEITDDVFKQAPLINGIRYYFAVTAYSFNEASGVVPNNLETPLRIFTIIPQSSAPGFELGEQSSSMLEVTHVGTADGSVDVNVVDPTALTGSEYEVFFNNRQEIRNTTGDWVPAATIVRDGALGPDTVAGSAIDIAAVYGVSQSEIELHCILDLVTTDGNWSEGLTMTFPAGVNILRAPKFQALNHDAVDEGFITPIISGNTIIFGDTTQPNTGNGPFTGGDEWVIYIAPPTLPLSIDWKIFDDGWSGGAVNETGTTTVTEVGNLSRTANYWNLKDVTNNVVKLENQSVFAGLDLFPKRDDQITNVGLDAAQIVDGLQVNVDVGFEAPINFFSLELDSPTGLTELTQSSSTTTLDIQNYTIFSGTVSSKAIDNFDVGTDVLDELQQDYELRFTGVYTETSAGIFEVTSGGSMATVFRMVSGAALADHPLNPNPGTAEPFLIRIPFEVWNVDDPANPFQVNLTYRDRVRDGTERPFYAWNATNRMYPIIVNSPYDPNQVIQVDGGADQFNAAATWVLVMYGTNYNLGDVLKITYANPIQFAVDKYTFKANSVGYSLDRAKNEIDKVNVFPNPYYGVNSEELNKYNRFVTFTHLPPKATIRIFNLAGVLVRDYSERRCRTIHSDGILQMKADYLLLVVCTSLISNCLNWVRPKF